MTERPRMIALCAPPGAGKTTLLPYLVDALAPIVVIDLDEILDADGSLLGVPIACPEGEPHWPAYDRMWERFLGLLFRAGHSVLVLCPVPSAEGMAQPHDPPIEWWLLDVPADVRRERLVARGWAPDRIEEELTDGEVGRSLVPTANVISPNPGESPESLAARVAANVGRPGAGPSTHAASN